MDDTDFLLGLYRKLYLIRRTEELLIELARDKKIAPLVHLSIGQEGGAVGMCSALTDEDYIFSTHRDHAHYLAKGGSLKGMLAELAGKSTGCARGWGGSMHLVDPDVNMMGSAAIVGGSIPLAAGAALASKLRKDGRVAVAFIGDSAVEQGIFWETLNFAVVHNLPMIFLCENNLYATHAHILKRQPRSTIYDRVAPFNLAFDVVHGWEVLAVYDAAKKAVELARNGVGPSFIEVLTYRYMEHWGPNSDWHLGYRTEEEGMEWIKKRDPVKNFREYLKDKADIAEEWILAEEEHISWDIKSAWNFALESPPAHDLRAEKQRIESPSSKNYQIPENPSVQSVPSARMKYKDAIAEAHLQIMEKDPDVFLIGEGVDGIGGVYGITVPAFKKFGPERVIDTPISDACLTGIGIGAAIVGMRPIVSHQRTNFMNLAVGQILDNASMWKYMTGGRIRVPVTIRVWVARKDYEAAQHTHTSHSMYGHIAGLKVVMPASAYDAKGLTIAAVADDDPVIMLDSWYAMMVEDDVPQDLYAVPLGKSKVIREGKDITIVGMSSYVRGVPFMGKFLDGAMEVADMFEKEKGISIEVIDLISLRPLDAGCILDSVRKTRRLVVVDTGWIFCSISSEVLAIVAESGIRLYNPPVRIGMFDCPAPASSGLLEGYHPTAEDIINAVKRVMSFCKERV